MLRSSPSPTLAHLGALLAAVVVLLAPSPASAVPGTYIGCGLNAPYFGDNNEPAGTVNPGGYYYTTETASDPQNCQDICSVDQYPYAYYTSGSATDNCVCSNQGPSSDDIVTGTDDHSGCDDSDNYITYRVDSTFEQPTCYSTDLTIGGTAASGALTDVDSCFTNCTSGQILLLYWDQGNSDSPECSCSQTQQTVSGTTVTCDHDVWFVFQHSAAGLGSQLPRKRMRERLEAARREQARAICPNGLTACKINGVSGGAFECIDPRSELESCGGCVNGAFGASGPLNGTATGQDCSQMLGTKLGATTCHHGRCVAYSCLPGYQLVSGECVPQINL